MLPLRKCSVDFTFSLQDGYISFCRIPLLSLWNYHSQNVQDTVANLLAFIKKVLFLSKRYTKPHYIPSQFFSRFAMTLYFLPNKCIWIRKSEGIRITGCSPPDARPVFFSLSRQSSEYITYIYSLKKKHTNPLPAQPNRGSTEDEMGWRQHPKFRITAMMHLNAKCATMQKCVATSRLPQTL